MVMELLSGGELFHHISEEGRFSEQRAAAAVRDVASALQAIHAVQMVHCDIKVSSLFESPAKGCWNDCMAARYSSQPENLLFATPDKAQVKIADFGLSRIKPPGGTLKGACGSAEYIGTQPGCASQCDFQAH